MARTGRNPSFDGFLPLPFAIAELIFFGAGITQTIQLIVCLAPLAPLERAGRDGRLASVWSRTPCELCARRGAACE